MASGQPIPIVSVGDVRTAFTFPGKVRPLCVVQPTDVWFVPALKMNLVSLRAMESRCWQLLGRNSSISLFNGTLMFPTRGKLFKMVGFPLTPSRLRVCLTLEKVPDARRAMLGLLAVRWMLSLYSSKLIKGRVRLVLAR